MKNKINFITIRIKCLLLVFVYPYKHSSMLAQRFYSYLYASIVPDMYETPERYLWAPVYNLLQRRIKGANDKRLKKEYCYAIVYSLYLVAQSGVCEPFVFLPIIRKTKDRSLYALYVHWERCFDDPYTYFDIANGIIENQPSFTFFDVIGLFQGLKRYCNLSSEQALAGVNLYEESGMPDIYYATLGFRDATKSKLE